MKVSTRTRYGLRFLMYLAIHYGRPPIRLRQIAKTESISEKYLEQIVIQLRGKGLVIASRGAKGGYKLAEEPEKISLQKIISCLEGESDLVFCVKNKDSCTRIDDCCAHEIWKQLSQNLNNYFKSITLADILNRQDQ